MRTAQIGPDLRLCRFGTAWHKILVRRIPTKRKGPSDDDEDEDDDDDDDDDDFSDSRSNRLLVIPPFSLLRYGQIGI